jgi:hypothetical protein
MSSFLGSGDRKALTQIQNGIMHTGSASSFRQLGHPMRTSRSRGSENKKHQPIILHRDFVIATRSIDREGFPDMAYRNKTYICFDGDTDMNYYRLMQAWKDNENHDFNFHNAHDLNTSRDSSQEESIKRQLRDRPKTRVQIGRVAW